eukprot:Polyplicarium_translucidae@DN2710_c1_g1_i2.p3
MGRRCPGCCLHRQSKPCWNTRTARIFTVIDALQGFHQIPMNKEDQCKTAFITQEGTYEYRRIPGSHLQGKPGDLRPPRPVVVDGKARVQELPHPDERCAKMRLAESSGRIPVNQRQ